MVGKDEEISKLKEQVVSNTELAHSLSDKLHEEKRSKEEVLSIFNESEEKFKSESLKYRTAAQAHE